VLAEVGVRVNRAVYMHLGRSPLLRMFFAYPVSSVVGSNNDDRLFDLALAAAVLSAQRKTQQSRCACAYRPAQAAAGEM
jgi:hypothetical protein